MNKKKSNNWKSKTILAFKILLLFGSFYVAPKQMDAQPKVSYWNGGTNGGGENLNYAINSEFSVVYDTLKGEIIITSFLRDESYSVGLSSTTLFADDASISYVTENGNVVFFKYNNTDIKIGMELNNQIISDPNGQGRGSRFRIYLPIDNDIINATGIHFNIHLKNTFNNNYIGYDEGTKTIPLNIPKLGNLKIDSYEFKEDGNVYLSWSSNENATSRHSKTFLQGTREDGILIATGTSSGIFPFPQSSYPFRVNLFQGAYDINGNYQKTVWTKSPEFTIPAFTHPTDIKAIYNSKTNKVDVTWTINQVGSVYEKCEFKLQRATKPDFSDAVTIDMTSFQSTKYSPDLTSYTYSDEPHAGAYYRVARDYQGWGWALGKSTQFGQGHAVINSVSNVKLNLDTSLIQANLSWDTSGIWTNGAIFIITRLNRTNNTSTTIQLGKDEYYAGKYTDSFITSCNEYYYTLQVKPADNLGFIAEKPYQTINSVVPTNIGNVTGFTASKGYFPDRTELRWTSQGQFNNFIVKRKIYGSKDDYTQITTVPGSTTSSFQTDDPKGTPGVYYQYMVVGTVNCNNTIKYSRDKLYTIGFRSPTGNIYGRVTYKNGQPVENVAVRLESNNTAQLGQSIYLNGNTASYLKLDSLHTPLADSAFTIETWLKPDDLSPKNMVLFSRNNQYELGFNASGKIYFTNNNSTVVADYNNLTQSFIHIAGIRRNDSLVIMINDSVMASISAPSTITTNVDKVIYIGRNASDSNFKGYIDEMRLWNKGLSDSIIKRNYTILLTGEEKGLIAYWKFDETISDQFYDLSHQQDQYNQNDGTMNALQVERSKTIPSPDQLSLKAYTDASGNYFISGIPYFGSNGTTYTIIPLFGSHQFAPISVTRLLSANSPSFSVDFTDNSSFPVSGTVYYKNSTVPVEGVQFKIDGQFAQENNGTLIQTDATGKFTISVPVGYHEVKAVKNHHLFVNDGKITDRLGNNLNYQNAVSSIKLYDNTTIRFAGRVAGGAMQEAYPLGHSLSSNNLGKQLSLTLQLNNPAFDLIMGGPDSTFVVNHSLPSNVPASNKPHNTSVVYSPDKVIIYPDPVTGEFQADLIPERFNVINVNATGWGNLLENKIVSLDFTNKFVTQNSVHNYKDSTQSKEGNWSYQNYSDTVFYHDSYQFIKRVTPNFIIAQTGGSGKILDYFGDSLFQSQSLAGVKDTIVLIDTTKTDKELYVFTGNPVFTQGVIYNFKLMAFESYPFYESIKSDGTPVIGKKNNKDIVEEVPTRDGSISIYNQIKNGPATPDTLSIDSTGMVDYQFYAGDPNTIAPGTKSFSASIKFGQATTVNWKWFGTDQMQAYVTGSKQAGTDFVTAGPNKMLMVLRDPPGNKSHSFAEKGSTISNSTTYSGSIDLVRELEATTNLGVSVITFAGIGAGVISKTEVKNDLGLGASLETHYTNNDTKVTTTTLTSRFQTSDDPAFVGAPADLFVGYSTNISYGQSNNFLIVHKDNIETTDKILNPGSPSDYRIVQKEGFSLGEKFGTLFAYPQQHIENVLIPNLLKIRNTLLHTSGSMNGQAVANSTQSPFYESKLRVDDPNFGKSNSDKVFVEVAQNTSFDDGPSYKIYFPTGSEYRTDSISTINQYISQWKEELKNNEKAKVNSKLLQNYSFHAGNPINYSEKASSSETKINSFDIILSGKTSAQTGAKVMGMGFTVKLTQSAGTRQGGSFENTTGNESTIGFQLAASGVGEYISVDVNKVTDGGFAFRTKGGQTECPYEGEVKTKYYLPGTVLDQPTIQMDKPQISVDKAVVNGVPSSRPATFTLTMNNASDAQWSTNYVLGYGNTDNIQGALISVDGASIAGGRIYPINYGQNVTKILTLKKGPDAMDYNNIPIILQSACQYDPTGYQQIIADTVLISAHFIPSCSEVHIKSPADKWVVNSKSPVNGDNKRILPINIDQFDVNNKLFDHIELQYKPTSESNWITVMKFYADTTKLNAAQGEAQLITNTQGINYSLVMDDGTFNDQEYDIQAVSYCLLGPDSYVTTESNKISGIKDTYWPRLFGSPQPANGVLGISDQIRLNFNEPIASGLLTAAKFQVTGIRNGSLGDHSVSVKLDGQSNYIATEFNKNLNGKNITAEMWILPDNLRNETIFSQGNTNESMELSLTADKHLEVTIGKKTIKSDQPIDYQKDQWAHVSLIYNAADETVSATYNFVGVINNAPVESYHGIGHFEFGRSISKQGKFFSGKMHEARIWMKPLTAAQLQINSLKRLSGAEEGLMGYYPMHEGKGKVIIDKAHGSNAQLKGDWSTPAGKAYQFNGDGYIKVNTSYTPITAAMDYTLELWFKGEAGQKDATLVSNGKGDGTENSKDLFSLGFENGLLTFQNNGTKIQAVGNYLDNTWHHLAIAVNRNSGIAQVFVDGGLKKYFDVKNIGGIASPYTYLGARAWYDPNDATKILNDQFFKGKIDEFRIWNTYLNETLINKNNNVRLKGDEIGLLAYYPFEKYYEFQNIQAMDSTLNDMKIQEDPKLVIPIAIGLNAVVSDDKAPIIDRGPVANLLFDYVVNNDALIINLLEPKQVVDKTIITFKVKDVRDQNGNSLASPITWTAYIDQNQLKWSDNELNLSKELYSPLKFESVIINSGGNVQNFRLTNLPAWLTATPSAGTVGPKSNQKIIFTVNEGLNVGTYNEIINMVNDNDEAEALTLNLTVNGKSPDWSVNPADYKYSMVIYGKIRIKNVFSSDKGDILAAFSNGKCVGVAHNTYFAANDFWYTFLTIYSDSLQSQNLEFRIWDAGKGKIYEATSSQSISFVNDGIAGTSGTPVIFDASEIQFQNITLNKGWNWISFNLANTNMTNVSAALKNAQWQSGDIIKNNETGFNQYSTSQSWVGTLSKLNNTSLFQLNTANSQTLSMKGALIDLKETPLSIKGNRWNYIGYLPLVNLKIKDALAGYEASNEDVIKSQTGFSMYDSRNGWVGNLSYLKPGEGYMLFRKSNSDASLVYPQISGNLIERKMGPVRSFQLPVQSHTVYAGNMTMAAVVEEDFGLLPDDIILAFAGDELRGKALSIENPVTRKATFFLNISGDKEEPIHFKVERNGIIIAQSKTIVDYHLDAEFGTLKNPFMLHFRNANDEIVTVSKEVTISPNPFRKKINIQVRLSDQQSMDLHEIQISIFDITGRLIIKRTKEPVKNGYYETSWNGKNADNVDCARGFYFIQITIDGVPTVYKVIKD